jgi:hypothetical protein
MRKSLISPMAMSVGLGWVVDVLIFCLWKTRKEREKQHTSRSGSKHRSNEALSKTFTLNSRGQWAKNDEEKAGVESLSETNEAMCELNSFIVVFTSKILWEKGRVRYLQVDEKIEWSFGEDPRSQDGKEEWGY